MHLARKTKLKVTDPEQNLLLLNALVAMDKIDKTLILRLT